MDVLSVWMCINANCLKGATPGTEALLIIPLVLLNLMLSLPSNSLRDCIQVGGQEGGRQCSGDVLNADAINKSLIVKV